MERLRHDRGVHTEHNTWTVRAQRALGGGGQGGGRQRPRRFCALRDCGCPLESTVGLRSGARHSARAGVRAHRDDQLHSGSTLNECPLSLTTRAPGIWLPGDASIGPAAALQIPARLPAVRGRLPARGVAASRRIWLAASPRTQQARRSNQPSRRIGQRQQGSSIAATDSPRARDPFHLQCSAQSSATSLMRLPPPSAADAHP
mmetsp:Transcript_94486/g.283175  ORF Transcript_94486/g.283175 Transcript_94486/m.283175 type:complete len:203 (-) Transcript_94486:32-640(-)